jgi:hypothetical protein
VLVVRTVFEGETDAAQSLVEANARVWRKTVAVECHLKAHSPAYNVEAGAQSIFRNHLNRGVGPCKVAPKALKPKTGSSLTTVTVLRKAALKPRLISPSTTTSLAPSLYFPAWLDPRDAVQSPRPLPRHFPCPDTSSHSSIPRRLN